MTKSELIDRMVDAQAKGTGLQLTNKDVELAVKAMLEQMSWHPSFRRSYRGARFWQLFAALSRTADWP
jgi:hypothetical protein